jgi:hypothetical protein
LDQFGLPLRAAAAAVAAAAAAAAVVVVRHGLFGWMD